MIHINNHTGILAYLAQPSDDSKNEMMALSKAVANAVAGLSGNARQLKGLDLVDPDDPQVIAEKELKVAAAMIEEAARKLANLRPKEQITFGDDMTFDELILEAAGNIMIAVQSLMVAAQYAQKVLLQQGRINVDKTSEKYHDDASWSEGLVSAMREASIFARSAASAFFPSLMRAMVSAAQSRGETPKKVSKMGLTKMLPSGVTLLVRTTTPRFSLGIMPPCESIPSSAPPCPTVLRP